MELTDEWANFMFVVTLLAEFFPALAGCLLANYNCSDGFGLSYLHTPLNYQQCLLSVSSFL